MAVALITALLSTDILFVSKSVNETAFLLDYIHRARLRECAFTQQVEIRTRFYLVTVFGSACALISFIENSMVLLALASKKQHRESSFLYLIVLSFFDSFVAFAYVPLIAANLLIDYTQHLGLIRIWWKFFIPTFAATHVSMTAGCYLILAATFERYLVTLKSKGKLLIKIRKNRVLLCLLAVILALITKGTLVLEMKLEKHPFCEGMTEYKAQVNAEIVNTFWYGTVYKFWLRNIATVFVPFFLLILLNFGIVVVLRRQERRAQLFRFANSDHKSRLRSATRMLVCVVCTYLAANLLNVIVTLWEHIDKTSLLNNYLPFYTYCADLVSLLTVMAGVVRPIIYLKSNQQIRNEVKQLCSCLSRSSRRKSTVGKFVEQIKNGGMDNPHGDDAELTQRTRYLDFDKVTVAIAIAKGTFMRGEHEKSDEEIPLHSNFTPVQLECTTTEQQSSLEPQNIITTVYFTT